MDSRGAPPASNFSLTFRFRYTPFVVLLPLLLASEETEKHHPTLLPKAIENTRSMWEPSQLNEPEHQFVFRQTDRREIEYREPLCVAHHRRDETRDWDRAICKEDLPSTYFPHDH